MVILQTKSTKVFESKQEFKKEFGVSDAEIAESTCGEKTESELYPDEFIDEILSYRDGLYHVNHNFNDGVHTVKKLSGDGIVEIPLQYENEDGEIDLTQLRDDIALILDDYDITNPSFDSVHEEVLEAVLTEFLKRVGGENPQ